MEVLGAVVGIADVALRTTMKITRLCNAWREAPEDVHRLLGDLTRTQLFFQETRHGIQTMFPMVHDNKGTISHSYHQLHALLDEGSLVLREIEDIVDTVIMPDGVNPDRDKRLGQRSRAKWLKHSAKIAKLRKELNGIAFGACRLLLAQNVAVSTEIQTLVERSKDEIMYHFSDQLNQRVESSQRSIITHVDRRFSFLQSVVVAAIRESIVEELTPLRLQLVPQHAITTTSTSLLQRSVTPPGGMHPCDMVCRCSCHSAGGCFKWRMTAPRPILGSISLTYSRTRVCNDSECRARQMRVSQPRLEIKVAYQFPAWLMRGALSVFFSSNLNGNPELNIRIFNVIQSDPVTAYSTIFGYIDRGDVHGTRRLLEERRGSVYDVLGHGGSSPLFFAVRRRNLNKEIIRLLLQAGADPNQEAPNGLTPTSATLLYYLAGRRGGDELVELLPPYSLLESESCLHMAIAGILQVDLGQALQKPQYLAEINSMSKLMNGRSPLCLAAMRGNLSAVKLLLRAGADVNLKVIKAGTTALHEACSSGRHEVVKVLLEAGALVNERTSNGLTPITVAARVSEGARIISLLIRHGANVQAGPLQVAAATGNTAAVDILLGSGADINHRDWEGDTALFEAIIGRQHGTADLLLLKGIDYTNVNDNGRGLKKLRNLNTAAKDRTGKTPLQLLNERDPTPALRKAFDELLDSVERVMV